jgi:HK97 family phage major capsid protein
MDIKDLKGLIAETIKEEMKPIQEKQTQYEETQRKYASAFENKSATPEVKEPGMTFTRAIKCLTLAKNDPDKALYYALGAQGKGNGMYPSDSEVHALLKTLSATTPSEGGFLIAEQYSRDIIPLLYSKTAVVELGARRVPMPNGNLNLPKLTGGSTSYYQGENSDATVSQPTFGNVKLSSKKLITMVPISNDLIRNASPEADRIVRDDMVQQMRLKLDFTALYGDGSAFTPLGIKKSINTANISVATGTGTLSADVIGTMIGSLMGDNIPMLSVGFIFNSQIWQGLYNLKTTTNMYIYRDEMNRGTLNGFPFRVSNQIGTANATAGTTYSDIFFGDFSEFIMGDEMAFEFSSSTEASWKDSSGNYNNAFSQDQTILRIIAKHDFALRHDKAFRTNQISYS